ncbi:MAG: RsmB/NOP family class I SAM-dependent RNA methyltransferase [Beijerinckiaceae bacterium]
MNQNRKAFHPRGRRDRAEAPPPPPPGLAARVAAAAALADILGNGHTLEERFAADAAAGRHQAFDARDRALIRSIVTASLRRLGTIRAALAGFLDKGLPKKAGSLEHTLVAGAAQLLYLDVPDHAAVDLAVRAVRADPKAAPYASLANAVLRNVARARDDLREPADPFIDTPPWLAARWRKNWGAETAQAIALMHRREPTLDLTVRGDAAGWAEKLGGIVLPTGSVRLLSRDPVPELAGYADGEWWVQDAAAAIPARLLRVKAGERAADLCAAPGGKAAQLAANGASVVALDRSAERMKRLAENFERLRLPVEIAVGDALTFDAQPFDAILLDAPCTATGTIRRHPDVAWVKRVSDIGSLAAMQAKMLDRACALLKPGGRLVYCTCSMEPEEGEAQIAALLRRNPDMARDPVVADEIGGLADCLTPEGDVRTLPARLPNDDPRLAGLDGFFASRLIRRAR